jgi:tetratricopeptide (TPR) repeat protein
MPVTDTPEISPTPTFSPTPESSPPNSSTEVDEGTSPVQSEQQSLSMISWILIGALGISLLILLILVILLLRLKKRLDSSDEVMDTIMGAEYKALGDFATEKGNLPLARKCYRKAAQFETQHEDPYKIGLAYFQAEQYEEAIAELNKCLGDDMLKPKAYFYLAYSYLNLEKWEQAEEYFKEAMQLNADDPYIYVGLGFIAQSRQQYGQAKQYYKKALQIEPTCQEAQENLYQIRDY